MPGKIAEEADQQPERPADDVNVSSIDQLLLGPEHGRRSPASPRLDATNACQTHRRTPLAQA